MLLRRYHDEPVKEVKAAAASTKENPADEAKPVEKVKPRKKRKS